RTMIAGMIAMCTSAFAGSTAGILDKPTEERMGAPAPAGATVLLGAGCDLAHWQMENRPEAPITWICDEGVLSIRPKTGNLHTRAVYQDFQLHLEFNMVDAPGNSGLYIERRYEVQIFDSLGKPVGRGECGGIYKQRAPDVNACRALGAWQSYDIVFRSPRWDGERKVENARITVVLNGKMLHDDVEITAKTGAGLPEGPGGGFLRLQDHGDVVRFRNGWIKSLELK
ncbi:MAG: hypothetical protein ACI9TH_001560, partial [Kiritimatiellia bacterium]